MEISSRYAADGKSVLYLSVAQKAAREQLRSKLLSGGYQIVRRPCALCGQSSFTVVAHKDRYGIDMDTGVCRSCGLTQTLDVLRPQDYADFYEKIYRRMYSGGLFTGPRSLFLQQYARGLGFRNLLAKNFPNLKTGEILEIGCAAGGILAAFSEIGFHVHGYDFDERYLRYGRDRSLDLCFGSLDSISPEKKFDLAILSHVLEHLYDLDASLEKIRSLLKPDGLLLIEVPGLLAIDFDRYNFDFLRYLQSAHLYHFDSALLTALLAKHGFICRYIDEVVVGVFQRTDSASEILPDPERHGQVLAYLQRIDAERRRQRVSLFIHRQVQALRSFISVLSRFIGVKGAMDRLRGRRK